MIRPFSNFYLLTGSEKRCHKRFNLNYYQIPTHSVLKRDKDLLSIWLNFFSILGHCCITVSRSNDSIIQTSTNMQVRRQNSVCPEYTNFKFQQACLYASKLLRPAYQRKWKSTRFLTFRHICSPNKVLQIILHCCLPLLSVHSNVNTEYFFVWVLKRPVCLFHTRLRNPLYRH